MKRIMFSKFIMFVFAGLLIIPLISPAHPSGKGKENKFSGVFHPGVVIDGKAGDWNDSLFFFNAESGVYYSMANDSNSLVFCAKVCDEGQQMKALREGVEIRIDPKGKKSGIYSLRFPLSTTLKPTMPPGGNQDPKSRRNARLVYILQAKDMELAGFKPEFNGIQSNTGGKGGAKAVMMLDSTGVLIWEARIPFKLFNTDLTKSEPLSAGIIIHGMNSQKPRNGEESHHNEGGGIGGNPGGQYPGGNPGMGQGMEGGYNGDRPRPGSNDKMTEDVSLWKKFIIIK
jgi:hypothetical protein